MIDRLTFIIPAAYSTCAYTLFGDYQAAVADASAAFAEIKSALPLLKCGNLHALKPGAADVCLAAALMSYTAYYQPERGRPELDTTIPRNFEPLPIIAELKLFALKQPNAGLDNKIRELKLRNIPVDNPQWETNGIILNKKAIDAVCGIGGQIITENAARKNPAYAKIAALNQLYPGVER